MKDRLDQAYGAKRPDAQGANNAASPKPGPADRPGKPANASGGKPKSPSGGDARSALAGAGRPPKAGTPAAPGKSAQTVKAESAKASSLLKTGPRGLEKAAKFLLLLGQDEAAKVIRHLKPEEIEKVSREIAGIDHIGTDEANEILTEFGWLVKTQAATIEGGPAIAEAMLASAFGAEKARAVLRKAAPETAKPFLFLATFEAPELLALLKDESPMVLSVILPYLDPRVASKVIQGLGEAMRVEVVRRIARLDKVDPEVLRRVEEGALEKARRMGSAKTESIDGRAALADILRHVGGGLEDEILERLGDSDQVLSDDIRERLFTLDDILRVRNRDVQASLRELSERQIALVLKGKSQAFRDKLLSNVSQSRRLVTLEEYEILGSVRRDESEKATREYLAWFKAKWDSGDLSLEGDDELVD